jgi:hypothetical protein
LGKRAFATLFVAVLSWAGLQLPAPADNGPEAATTFGNVRYPVTAGDIFSISCDDFEGGADSTYWLAYALEGSYYISRGQGVSQFIDEGLRVRVRLDTETHEVELDEGSTHDHAVPEYGGIVQGNERTLRVVWASWHTTIACRVEVNGLLAPSEALPTDKAHLATTNDLSGGAGAEAGVAGAAITGTYAQTVDDCFCFSWMYADGLASARAPDGTSAGSTHTFWVGATKGTFTYTITAAANIPSPRIFLLETPK